MKITSLFKDNVALNSFRRGIERCMPFLVFVNKVVRAAKNVNIQFANQAYNIFEVWKNG